MPLVSKNGGLVIAHDVKLDKYDEKGQKTQEGNGLKPLKITFGAHCDYNPNSKTFKKIVRRGIPNPAERNWINGVNPVWRIPHEDLSQEDLLRLLDFYKLNKTQRTKHLLYEPDVEDFEVKHVGPSAGRHLPIWFLDELILMDELDRSLVESIMDDPHTKRLDEPTKKMLLEILEDRRANENITEEEQDAADIAAKKRGDKARLRGRQKQVAEKKQTFKDAEFEARLEENARKVTEKLSKEKESEKDGVLSGSS